MKTFCNYRPEIRETLVNTLTDHHSKYFKNKEIIYWNVEKNIADLLSQTVAGFIRDLNGQLSEVEIAEYKSEIDFLCEKLVEVRRLVLKTRGY